MNWNVVITDYRLFTAILKISTGNNSCGPDGIYKRKTDNIRRTLDVMRNIKDKQIEAVIYGMDAEKAFDLVKWDFLYRVFFFFLTFMT